MEWFWILNLVVLLYIWFDTDAIPEWASVFRLKFLKYAEFNEARDVVSVLAPKTYTDFLLRKYGDHFIIRMITCPVCLSVWMNLGLLCVVHRMGVVSLGANIVATWLLYHILQYTLLKLNER